MSKMETDEQPVVLSSTTMSALSLALHPLPIMNISEHLTRLQLQKNIANPFVIGALLGTQNGREVEVVNTFELCLDDETTGRIDHGFLVQRKDQYKEVFPSLEFIGWYTVAQEVSVDHLTIHQQFLEYTATPLLLILQPSSSASEGHSLPIKAYEPTVEIRDNETRYVYIEANFSIETGEAERIAVDWTAKGGEGGTSLGSHLQTQRAAVKMLHDRIQLLIQYVSNVAEGTAPVVDYVALRSLSALIASLPATEHPEFRKEFDKEYEDVQLTAFLSALTSTTNALNDIVDKHNVMVSSAGDRGPERMRKRGMGPGRMGMIAGEFDRDRGLY